MIFGTDEKKRSKIWQLGVTASTVVIILIVAFFIVQIFIANPLVGTWENEYTDMEIEIKNNDEAVVEWLDETISTEEIEVTMPYTVDTDMKTLVLRKDEDAIVTAAKRTNGVASEEQIRSVVENLEGCYEYNIEGEYLTLTDREYGEQMVFEKD